ncbi:MAG TPA: hypothetical protein PJ982_11315, partial [Lacipirellulaceae bacterium]|nr:hypothetical protein [Lacipirellulaceae bacterium]
RPRRGAEIRRLLCGNHLRRALQVDKSRARRGPPSRAAAPGGPRSGVSSSCQRATRALGHGAL